MNSLEILNILKNDAFTKTLFTDVLPSDRLPGRIQTRPKGFIVSADPANKPGIQWLVIFITTDGKGEFWGKFAQRPGFYGQNFTQFLNKHCSAFMWKKELCKPLHQTFLDNIHYSLCYIDVYIFQCQPLRLCLRAIKSGTKHSCATLYISGTNRISSSTISLKNTFYSL